MLVLMLVDLSLGFSLGLNWSPTERSGMEELRSQRSILGVEKSNVQRLQPGEPHNLDVSHTCSTKLFTHINTKCR